MQVQIGVLKKEAEVVGHSPAAGKTNLTQIRGQVRGRQRDCSVIDPEPLGPQIGTRTSGDRPHCRRGVPLGDAASNTAVHDSSSAIEPSSSVPSTRW